MIDPEEIPPEDMTPVPPLPLDYFSHPKPPRDSWVRSLHYFGGALAAIVAVAIVGAIRGLAHLQLDQRLPRDSTRGDVIFFSSLGIAGFVALAIAIIRGRRQPPWFLLGLLTGLCVTALIEGRCFVNY